MLLSFFNKGNDALKARGKQIARDLISYVLAMYNASIKIPSENKMDGVDIVEAGYILIEKMEYYRIEDLILCLRMAKEGKFGPIYNRVDIPTILMAWGQYVELHQKNFEMEKSLEKSSYGQFRTEEQTMQIRKERHDKAEQAEREMKARIRQVVQKANFDDTVK